jgi:hypothetical protein
MCTQGLVLAKPAVCHLSFSTALSTVGIFLIQSHIYSWVSLNHDSPIYTSYLGGMKSIYHYIQFGLRYDLAKILPILALNSNLCLLSSEDYGCDREPTHPAHYF